MGRVLQRPVASTRRFYHGFCRVEARDRIHGGWCNGATSPHPRRCQRSVHDVTASLPLCSCTGVNNSGRLDSKRCWLPASSGQTTPPSFGIPTRLAIVSTRARSLFEERMKLVVTTGSVNRTQKPSSSRPALAASMLLERYGQATCVSHNCRGCPQWRRNEQSVLHACVDLNAKVATLV